MACDCAAGTRVTGAGARRGAPALPRADSARKHVTAGRLVVCANQARHIQPLQEFLPYDRDVFPFSNFDRPHRMVVWFRAVGPAADPALQAWGDSAGEYGELPGRNRAPRDFQMRAGTVDQNAMPIGQWRHRRHNAPGFLTRFVETATAGFHTDQEWRRQRSCKRSRIQDSTYRGLFRQEDLETVAG